MLKPSEQTPLALARLAQGNAETSAMQDVYIQGDMHTARALQQLLRAIDIDWEELLAQAIGDTPAHQLARLLRGAAGWGRQTANKVAQDLADYLRFERNDVPTQHDVTHFIDEVDRLRDDVERLDARLRRLRQRRQPHR